jgi:Tfp pilus assembly protein PilV
MFLRPRISPQAGTTLVEVMVAALVTALFFSSIFQVNAICLNYISSSKENISGIECIQDRLEQLRNTDFSTLTDTTAMTTLLTTPPNSSFLPLKATETVTIRTFTNGAPTTPSITFNRGSGASVAPTHSPAGTVRFGSNTLIQVDVRYDWSATFGSRPCSEQSSTIIAAGTKK